MRMTGQKQLNILAERTHDLKKNMFEKDNQRRNQPVDLFGVDISRQSTNGEALYYVSISSDLVYYERFQFKIYIESAKTLTNFKIFVRSRVRGEDGKYRWEDIDITPYLKAQTEDPDDPKARWIDGDNDGIAWPNNDPVDEESEDDTAGNSYDILEVVSMMHAEGKYDLADAVGRAEFKRFIFRADQDFFGAMILYLKYSHLNR